MTAQFLLAQNAILSYLTSPYISWFPIVLLAATAAIGVVAMIYMLSAAAGRDNIRIWAKIKIYEILMSLTLVFIFLAISTFFLSFNFESVFNSVGLVPQACQSNVNTDFYSLALCNMREFNQNVLHMNELVYYIGLRMSFVPKLSIDLKSTGIDGVSLKGEMQAPSAFGYFTGEALTVLYGAFVLSQVQLLILAASLLFFSVFMGMGLISRMFVVTRSFGGAMIAFGIGLGILFPLMVSFTYGYINVGIDSYKLVGGVSVLDIGASLTAIFGLILMLIVVFIGGIVPGTNGFLVALLKVLGLEIVGLSIIPLLNFIILDVFVSDFSGAVGEKVNFISLVSRLI